MLVTLKLQHMQWVIELPRPSVALSEQTARHAGGLRVMQMGMLLAGSPAALLTCSHVPGQRQAWH